MPGLQIYDPLARLTQPRRPVAQPQRQQPRPATPKPTESVTGDPYKDLAIAQMRGKLPTGGGGPAKPKDDSVGGIINRSPLGTGLGYVINNPVVKGLSKPLEVLGMLGKVFSLPSMPSMGETRTTRSADATPRAFSGPRPSALDP